MTRRRNIAKLRQQTGKFTIRHSKISFLVHLAIAVKVQSRSDVHYDSPWPEAVFHVSYSVSSHLERFLFSSFFFLANGGGGAAILKEVKVSVVRGTVDRAFKTNSYVLSEGLPFNSLSAILQNSKLHV